MKYMNPGGTEFLRRPTRVSRLYPVLTFVLMLSSSALVYAWQENQIISGAAVVQRDQEISHLEEQVRSLTSQQKLDQATVQVQKQQITDTASKLAALQKQIDSTTADLAQKGQLLQQAEDQLKNQKDQLSSNATELQNLRSRPPLFSFQNKSALTDIAQQEADVKALITNAYPYIQKIYGDPYLLHSVTITFVNEFTIAGAAGEILIENSSQGLNIDIHIKSFDKNSFEDNNTVLHEVGHAQHGLYVLDRSAHEEGENVAFTDVLMATMIADGKLPNFGTLYINISESTYQRYNSQLKVYADNDAFYQYPQVGKVYQMIGYAWMQLYKQDHDFFKKFNAAYYAKIDKGQKVDIAGIQDIIRSVISTVNGESIDSYLQKNRAFNPD
jgi:hypothetical protein